MNEVFGCDLLDKSQELTDKNMLIWLTESKAIS